MGAVHNATSGVREQILAGKDLRIFLKPDASVRNRKGTQSYIESLDLPHVIINRDGHFWACQRKTILSVSPRALLTNFYAYYSGMDIFSSSTYEKIDATAARQPNPSYIMSTGRYEQLRWIVHGEWWPVFDSTAKDGDINPYITAIEAGCRFKAVIEKPDRVIQVHPISYPFYYPDQERLDVQTDVQFFPDYMRMKRDALETDFLGTDAEKLADYRLDVARELAVLREMPFFSSYFRLFENGHGVRIEDVRAQREIRFRRVQIFASF